MSDSRIDSLEHEVAELRQTVVSLQSRVEQLQQTPQPQVQQPSQYGFAAREEQMRRKREEKKQRAHANKGDFETTIGVHYLGRIGMIGLILGIGFFLKYSFDNNLVGPTTRIILGYLSGAGLLGLGELFRRKYALWSRIFTGGGLVVLYFATYAAQHFYAFFSLPVTILVMTIITVVAALFAIFYNSIVIAFFGLVGGFVTPLIITGEGPEDAFLRLSYVVLLSLAVAVLSTIKQWRALDMVAFVATVLYFGAHHGDLPLVAAVLFLLVFYFIFSYSTLMLTYRDTGEHEHHGSLLIPEVVLLYIIANALFVYSFLYTLLEAVSYDSLGWAALGLALFYGLQVLLMRRLKEKWSMLTWTLLAAALAFAAVAIGVWFDLYWVTILWSVFAVGVIFAGFKIKEYTLRTFGLGLLLLSLSSFFYQDFSFFGDASGLFLLNTTFGTGLFPLAGLILTSWLYASRQSELDPSEASVAKYATLATHLLALVLLTNEVRDAIEAVQVQRASISILWGLYAAALVVGGIVARSRTLRLLGLGFFALVVAKVTLFDLSALETIYRVVAFTLLGIILILSSFFYQRQERGK